MRMNRYVKSVLVACLIAGSVLLFTTTVLAPVLPQVVGRADVHESREFAWERARTLRLHNEDGFVRVTTHNGDDTRLSVSVRAYTGKNVTAQVAEEYVKTLFEVSRDPASETVEITTEPKERPDGLDLYADYTVRVPEGMDVEIENANGNVRVYEGCGQVHVRGRNMDVIVHKPQGEVAAESLNGRIQVFGAPKGARLRTINGSVYAHLSGGRLEAGTTNGTVTLRVLDPAVEGSRLTTQNGHVKLVLCPGCSAQVDARTERGTVRANIAMDTTSGLHQRRHLRGKLGDGRANFLMTTLNGDIWVSESKP